ncbi:tRNA (adenosine(37)-N6)-threonylcarbamoyltransferase complex dimerization subunit type 1 TsaB [Portibacter marinus]|uniref:tRNA (adenosine(37)-N6)-threonylcarbamoyltransferase complex dimerization subunit type 1 TsaB n=1 Tax=Portibacter marinus TaxID=2898660 RepID=UPI001F328EA8|nr:tRNA (adenosine(37)-N6)-threonylcarbamoyltransferase complex dimerization subunit type 1 TsaB [Portibacter marinus]
MAYILSLESSSRVCSVALSNKDQLIYLKESSEPFSHTRKITLFIQECLQESGISVNQLEAIAVSHGPGSYTGLRVSAATAKGLCYGLQIPLIAVDTLKAIAWKAREEEDAEIYIPMIDARRMEVYTAVYDQKLEKIKPTHNLILEKEVMDEFTKKLVVLCGTGVEKARSIFENKSMILMPFELSANYIFNLAYQQFTEQNFENIASYSPNYFKAPRITTSKKPLF